MSLDNDSNNRTSIRPPTWEDERRNVNSFSGLSPQSVNEFLSSIGYLFGVRVDSHSGPKRSRYKIATVKEGKHPYIEEATEVDSELVTTNTGREANYMHRGWSPSALPSSPWTRLRTSNNNTPSQSKESITRRIIVYRLQIELLQEDLVPTPEFEAAVRDALGRRTRSERFKSVYQLFERWGDVIPLAFDVGTSLTITDLKASYETVPAQDSMQLTGNGLRQLIERGAAKVSTQGVDLSVLRGGLESWMYSSDIPIGQWSQVRISKTISIEAILSKELQTGLSGLYDSMITYEPLAFKEETCSESTTKPVKRVSVYGADHISALVLAGGRYNEAISLQHVGVGFYDFVLDDDDHISRVMVWKDSTGVCAIQFFTHGGVVSKCYGGGGGTPEVMEGGAGYLINLEAQVEGASIYNLQAHYCRDEQSMRTSVEWGYSKYYGSDTGDRFNDLELMGRSTNAFITSVKIRAGSYDYIDGIQLTYSSCENGSNVTLEGPYHGGSGREEQTLNLGSEENIIAVGVNIPTTGRVGQLSFTTNRGRKLTFASPKKTDQVVTCDAPMGRDGRQMRLHTIVGRCGEGEYLNGVLFVWTSA